MFGKNGILSGQKTVSNIDGSVALGDAMINGTIQIKALPGNTGNVAIGNDGTDHVTMSNGLVLDAGDVSVVEFVGNINQIRLAAQVAGEGVSWLALNMEG